MLLYVYKTKLAKASLAKVSQQEVFNVKLVLWQIKVIQPETNSLKLIQ